jgi:SAM-dependent methyltransferase
VDDPRYLRNEQYRDGANLSARVELHRRFTTNPDGWYRWVFDRIAPAPGAAVLEIGCGTGNLWLENRDRLPPALRLVLADLSPGMVATARARLGDLAARPACLAADARALPFAGGSFDAVVANHVLYHVPDREWALAEVRRVLRRGGRFVAATNGRGHLRELDELVLGVAPEAARERGAERFGLENGADQLRPWFAGVVRHDYPDALAITEVEPVVDYVRSTPAREILDETRLDRLRAAVAATIAERGVFRATKAVGLFACVRGA